MTNFHTEFGLGESFHDPSSSKSSDTIPHLHGVRVCVCVCFVCLRCCLCFLDAVESCLNLTFLIHRRIYAILIRMHKFGFSVESQNVVQTRALLFQ